MYAVRYAFDATHWLSLSWTCGTAISWSQVRLNTFSRDARMNARERELLAEWAALHTGCAVCWWPERDYRRRLEVHHIVGGSARARGHDPRNYLSLCDRCHGVFHSGRVVGNFPDLYIGTLLYCKRETDAELYDPEYLASLKHRKHLGHDPIPPDEFYLQERQRNLDETRIP